MRTSFLKHYALAKGEAAQHHKYIRRYDVKGKWRYIYNEPATKKTSSVTPMPSSMVTAKQSTRTSNPKNAKEIGIKRIAAGKDIVAKTYSQVVMKNNRLDNVRATGGAGAAYISDGNGNSFVYRMYDTKILDRTNGQLPSSWVEWTSTNPNAKPSWITKMLSGKENKNINDSLVNAYNEAIKSGYKQQDKMLSDVFGKREGAFDVRVINPNYDTGRPEYRNNCYSCAIAMDLQKRGYNVAAIPDIDGEYEVAYMQVYDYPGTYGYSVKSNAEKNILERNFSVERDEDFYRDLVQRERKLRAELYGLERTFNGDRAKLERAALIRAELNNISRTDQEELRKQYRYFLEQRSSMSSSKVDYAKTLSTYANGGSTSVGLTVPEIPAAEVKDRVFETLRGQLDPGGSGTSGIVGITWTAGSGHAVYYEYTAATESAPEKLVITDPQSCEIVDLDEWAPYIYYIDFKRTDNLAVNANVFNFVQKAS